MRDYQILERVSQKTLFGIRFWDPALDMQIEDGLRVSLAPVENVNQARQAFKTRGGIYAFRDIPGLHAIETGIDDSDSGSGLSSPANTRTFVLNVEDVRQQFTSVSLLVNLPLPYDGLFLVDDPTGSPSTAPRGFNLYSAITRARASQFTFVRGELIDRNTNARAAHALVRVQTDGEFSWFGIADGQGRFAIMMPYPQLHITLGGSPPSSEGIRLQERTWEIELSVMYDPVSQLPIEGGLQPDYSSILSQNQALIYTSAPETDDGEVSTLFIELAYGRDLIVKTDGFSELYVGPTGSPA